MGGRQSGVKRGWALVGLVALAVLLAGWAAPRARQGARAPTVILVSLDGFRWDYLGRAPTPNLDRLIARGVRARWMTPVFPTLTFPNHYTIVTGLYPEHHGIVGNRFVDPTGTRFAYTDTVAVRDPRWWGGEPVWVTAERQGVHAGTHFWPGSEAVIGGVQPSFTKRYDGTVPNASRVQTLLSWLDLPGDRRPRFLTLYLSDADDAGHRNGPDAPEMLGAIRAVDSAVGLLVRGLERRRILGRVNIVVVSDHGMAPTSPQRLVYVEDYVDTARVDLIQSGALVMVSPRDGAVDRLYEALRRAPHVAFFRRADLPARLHYSSNPRIAPIVGLVDEGWEFTTHGAISRRQGGFDGGEHGYDSALPSMRAIFIAAGPAFRRGYVAEPFQNIHVYELICAVLGLRPAPNDGSLDSVRVMLR